MDFTIEELSLNAWPALKTLFCDSWIIRMANGYSNRSNSINMIYPSSINKINVDEKINYCYDIYTRHNLPANYKIISCEEHKDIERRLEALNYEKILETQVQVCDLSKIRIRNIEGITVNDTFDNTWKESVIEFNKIKDEHKSTFKSIMDNIGVSKIAVRKEAGGATVACGYSVLENNYAGLFSIVVKKEERGKGYGREITEALLIEAARRGIKKSYLQVDFDNTTALALYGKLGFREIYRYWYRVKR